MHKFLIVLAVIILGINLSCDKAPTEIEDKDHGRRDYVWTVDTINGDNGYLALTHIWGDSPDNIWICGGNGSNSYRVWNYDGARWRGLGTKDLYPDGIFGFGKKNIWASSGNQIWHFDGTKWKVNYEAVNDSFKIILFQKFYGKDENNIWLVGITNNLDNNEHGIIYHYDGSGWTQKFLSKDNNIHFYDIYPTENEDIFLIWGLSRGYNPYIDSSTIFIYDRNEVKKFCQSYYGGLESCWIKTLGDQIYITKENKIFRYNNNELIYLFPGEILENGLLIGGRNDRDIFVWKSDGLAHYNGVDTKYIFKQKTSIQIRSGIMVFDKEIFFFAMDRVNSNYYFVKGELKD